MTVEKRMVAGLGDIKAVIFECGKCRTRLTLRPEEIQLPRECPHPQCGQEWLSELEQDVRAPSSPHLQFCNALKQIRGIANQMPYRLLLEFEEQS